MSGNTRNSMPRKGDTRKGGGLLKRLRNMLFLTPTLKPRRNQAPRSERPATSIIVKGDTGKLNVNFRNYKTIRTVFPGDSDFQVQLQELEPLRMKVKLIFREYTDAKKAMTSLMVDQTRYEGSAAKTKNTKFSGFKTGDFFENETKNEWSFVLTVQLTEAAKGPKLPPALVEKLQEEATKPLFKYLTNDRTSNGEFNQKALRTWYHFQEPIKLVRPYTARNVLKRFAPESKEKSQRLLEEIGPTVITHLNALKASMSLHQMRSEEDKTKYKDYLRERLTRKATNAMKNVATAQKANAQKANAQKASAQKKMKANAILQSLTIDEVELLMYLTQQGSQQDGNTDQLYKLLQRALSEARRQQQPQTKSSRIKSEVGGNNSLNNNQTIGFSKSSVNSVNSVNSDPSRARRNSSLNINDLSRFAGISLDGNSNNKPGNKPGGSSAAFADALRAPTRPWGGARG